MKEHKNSYGIFSLLNFYTRVNILLPKQQPLNQLDYNESWAPKNWCFWTVGFQRTLESPLDYKEIQPIHPKGNQSWIFFERTDAEAETLILWPPDANSWLIWKDPDAGKDWRWEEKGMTEDEMAGWHHRLNGHEPEWTPGVGDGQGGLACCRPWGHKESDTTERLNWSELIALSSITFSLISLSSLSVSLKNHGLVPSIFLIMTLSENGIAKTCLVFAPS